MGFLFTPANCYDNQPVVELLDSFAHHLTHLLGERAYSDASLQSYLEQGRSLHLLTPVKENQMPKRCKSAQIQLNRLRLMYETVNSSKKSSVLLHPLNFLVS